MRRGTVVNRLLIVGAGGLGREVLSWAMQVPSDQRDWEIGGVLDWNHLPWEEHGFPFPMLGSPDEVAFRPDDRVVIALGEPRARLEVAERLARRGAIFTSIVHPSVLLGVNVRLGAGCMVLPHAVLSTNVRIGEHVLIDVHARVAHDVCIADGASVLGHADITGRVGLGEACVIGSHAVVLPGLMIGEGAVVGAGAVVTHPVPPVTTVVGVPARSTVRSAQLGGPP
jgi:sugar O-acyltransferase (sialic acid O-acetyltransferase NeuD family)